jgi:hypothetical protein
MAPSLACKSIARTANVCLTRIPWTGQLGEFGRIFRTGRAGQEYQGHVSLDWTGQDLKKGPECFDRRQPGEEQTILQNSQDKN